MQGCESTAAYENITGQNILPQFGPLDRAVNRACDLAKAYACGLVTRGSTHGGCRVIRDPRKALVVGGSRLAGSSGLVL